MKRTMLICTITWISITTLAAGLSMASTGIRLTATTKSGPACLEEKWLDDTIHFFLTDNEEDFRRYISERKCIMLRSGVTVYIAKWPKREDKKAQFRITIDGPKWWTLRTGLNYDNLLGKQ